jgi:addiction module HigA family antidote
VKTPTKLFPSLRGSIPRNSLSVLSFLRTLSAREMLLEEFLVPMEMTQRALAEELGLSVQSVNLIIKGKRGITAETAVRLSRVFKNSPQFWLGLQMDWDLWHAERDLAEVG